MFDQHVDDVLVGLENVLALEQRRARQETAVATHRVVDRQTVTLTDDIVLQPVTGRRVYRAGPCLQRDMITQHDGDLAMVEGMLQQLPFERRAKRPTDHLILVDIPARHALLEHAFGQNQAPITGLDQHVSQCGGECHPLVGWQGPGRGGPDHHPDLAAARPVVERRECGLERGRVDDRKTHIDGKGLLVLVLDLGLGQCGTTIGTPVDRLGTLADMPLFGDPAERTDDVGLLGKIHGQIRVIPVTQYAEALEVHPLFVDLGHGEITAGLAELTGADLAAGLANLLLDLQFDGQAVTVPAGHIGGIKTVQGATLDDDVLQHLVDLSLIHI